MRYDKVPTAPLQRGSPSFLLPQVPPQRRRSRRWSELSKEIHEMAHKAMH